MARQVITQSHVEHMLGQGATEVVLEPDAIVTAVAGEFARDHGLRLLRNDGPPTHPAPTHEPVDDDLTASEREQVRQAVVTALGHSPNDLDRVLDRVIGG